MTENWANEATAAGQLVELENSLGQSLLPLHELLKHISAIVYVTNGDGIYSPHYIGPDITDLLGYSREDYQANPELWKQQLHPDDRQRVHEAMERAHKTGKPVKIEYRKIARDGRVVWFRDEAVVVKNRDGRSSYFQGMMFDITAQKLEEEKFEESKRFQAMIANAMPNILYVFDHDARAIIFASRRTLDLLGFTPHDICSMGSNFLSDLVHPDDQEIVAQYLKNLETADDKDVVEVSFRLRHANGQWRWFKNRGCVFSRRPDGTVQQHLGTGEDITEHRLAKLQLREANRQLRKLATTDQLTALPNRRWFDDIFERELQRMHRYRGQISLAMLDIDGFKSYNDRFGHSFGDLILCEVSNLLRRKSRVSDIVARFAGDEFVILMPNTNAEDAYIAAQRLCRAASQLSVSDSAGMVRPTISIGVATTDTSEMITAEVLLRRADKALYAAKDAGRNCARNWETINKAS